MHDWINILKLEKHIEGGYFSVFYQADTLVQIKNSNIIRKAGTSIYFLLEKQDISTWHKLTSDEIWHFYDGTALMIHTIDQNGTYEKHILGNAKLLNNATYQVLIKSNTWFAAEVINKSSYALVGCTVCPGFEYQDFMLGNLDDLIQQFPQHKNIILFYKKC